VSDKRLSTEHAHARDSRGHGHFIVVEAAEAFGPTCDEACRMRVTYHNGFASPSAVLSYVRKRLMGQNAELEIG
jgi:hypothetical protein